MYNSDRQVKILALALARQLKDAEISGRPTHLFQSLATITQTPDKNGPLPRRERTGGVRSE